jgi:hypothetical protein
LQWRIVRRRGLVFEFVLLQQFVFFEQLRLILVQLEQQLFEFVLLW